MGSQASKGEVAAEANAAAADGAAVKTNGQVIYTQLLLYSSIIPATVMSGSTFIRKKHTVGDVCLLSHLYSCFGVNSKTFWG